MSDPRKRTRNQTASTPVEGGAASLPHLAYSTHELAKIAGVLPDSVRSSVWRLGHYRGIKPIKFGEGRRGRLLWPADAVDALFEKGGAK